MDVISEYFKQSELALAAYATLTSGVPDTQALQQENVGMSQSQAERFARDWRVVAQYTHSEQTPIYDDLGNITGYHTTSNGLSATVFQNKDSEQKYLAIRGTEFSLADVMADGGVLLHGVPELSEQYQSLHDQILYWQSSGVGVLDGNFTVCGHSLGGWLASGVAGEFGANVQHAYLYNAPGILGWNGSLTQLFLDALGRPNTIPPAGNVTSLRAASGASLIAGLGLPVTPPVGIEIEAASGLGLDNHSIVRLTDALAIQVAYAELAPSLSLAQISQIMRSASSQAGNTLESALDALRKTLLGADVAPTTEENRESLYANLYVLQESTAYQSLKGSAAARLTATQGRDELVTKARNDFGHFLAVKYLLPIALEGSSSQLIGAHGDLYAEWLADRDLTPEQRAAGQANFSDEYLADRAALLTWKNKFAIEDFQSTDGAYTKASDAWFADLGSGLQINLGSDWTLPADKPRYIFGADQSGGMETLSGGSQSDRLYGGGGDDVLYGYDGNDRLYGMDGDDTMNGGAGKDYLEGGAGNDTYIIGDGLDTIVDRDGKIVVGSGDPLIGSPERAQVLIPGLSADGSATWKDGNRDDIAYVLQLTKGVSIN